jgi:two-component system heavy metal sensor histidine kinase CusS
VTDSLRNRLLAGIIGGMTLLLVVFSLVIYVTMRRALVGQFDTWLGSTAGLLAAAVEVDRGEFELELDAREMVESRTREDPSFYQLWKPDGTPVLKSASLGEVDLPLVEARPGQMLFGEFKMKTGRTQRGVWLKFTPRIAETNGEDGSPAPKPQALILAVARDAGTLRHNLTFLRWLLLAACAGTIALSLLVAAVVVRQGLRPLNALAAEIAAVREDNLTTGIKTGQMPAEIVPIRDRLNDLLARLEASFGRERRFTADVAHELRTPLAGMRSTIEVALTKTREAEEYQSALSDCLNIAENMQTMVNKLLALARIETQQMTFRKEQVHLSELIDSCWSGFSDRAHEKELSFENHLPADLVCKSDADGLAMVFTNLAENAVEYSDRGGRIWVEGRDSEGSVEITFANTGCRLNSEQLAQVFDCFWRSDLSRSDAGNHCGLGLALAQRIITALGGRTSVKIREGGVFSIQVALPA